MYIGKTEKDKERRKGKKESSNGILEGVLDEVGE